MIEQTEVKHPAKFNGGILKELCDVVNTEITDHRRGRVSTRIFDPFAGVGGVHQLRALGPDVYTFGFELEPEWAGQSRHTICADARHIEDFFPDPVVDMIVTSPCYGNRMADHHDAREGSKRNTYKHTLGRDLTPGSAAVMQWGDEYREFHRDVWRQCVQMLKPGGLFILNCKDHIRKGVRQEVTRFHVDVLIDELGLKLEGVIPVYSRGNRQGENGDARVDHEDVIWMRKPAE